MEPRPGRRSAHQGGRQSRGAEHADPAGNPPRAADFLPQRPHLRFHIHLDLVRDLPRPFGAALGLLLRSQVTPALKGRTNPAQGIAPRAPTWPLVATDSPSTRLANKSPLSA